MITPKYAAAVLVGRGRRLPPLTQVRLKSNGTAKSFGRISTNIIGTRPLSVGSMTPAWKRHLIRQRRTNSKCNTSHATTLDTTTSKTPNHSNNTSFYAVVDRVKSFSIGTLAGMMGSLAGMGGGFVMIPLMTAASATRNATTTSGWWRGGLGLSQHEAHGTSLFAVGTTGLAGALGYGIRMSGDDEDVHNEHQSTDSTTKQPKGLVELDTALALTATAMVTARLGAISSSFLSERVLQRALGAFMICVAPLVPGKAYLEALQDAHDPSNPEAEKHLHDDEAKHTHHGELSQLERLLPASFIGMFSGFLSGMFGVGGGAIVVPSLVLSTDMSHHTALGTSLCAMVLPAMVGTYTHAKRGNVNWRVGPLLALGSAVGAYVGGKEVGIHMEEGVLQAGFSCLMLVLGVKTWRKS
jgi:uncharacterized membrane protein YfcA|mmetsp:Transcript_15823/g.34182  ORF Transcript_15823/g.34182 Transcript_15823/m.34182 type:complete len:411 (+) Transcript_15823:143-1375(+)